MIETRIFIDRSMGKSRLRDASRPACRGQTGLNASNGWRQSRQ